jgi:ACS family tartrate transporter-like MFS transporter
LSDADDHTLEASVIAKLTWRLMPFLFLLYIVAYLDRINVGFAALQMREELGFNDAVYGLGAGMFFAGYFVFQVPSNLILMRVGARRWISVLMIVWGLVSSATIFVRSAHTFYALRFLLGLAEAGFFPGMIVYLKSWFPAGARARTVARFMTAAPLSGVVGGPISGALLNLHHVSGLSGWQWLFLVEGLPAILFGIVVIFFLEDTPQNAAWLSPLERTWLVHELTREHQISLEKRGSKNQLAALLQPFVWLLALVYFGLNSCSYGISLWLPSVIHRLSSVSNLAIGVLSTIPYICAAIAMVLVGLHADKTGAHRTHVAAAAITGAIALFCAAFSTSVFGAITTLSIALLGVFAMVGPFWAIPTTALATREAPVGIAFINSLGNLGGFFGPYIIGLLKNSTGEFKGGLLAVGVTLAVSGCLVLLPWIPSGRALSARQQAVH